MHVAMIRLGNDMILILICIPICLGIKLSESGNYRKCIMDVLSTISCIRCVTMHNKDLESKHKDNFKEMRYVSIVTKNNF